MANQKAIELYEKEKVDVILNCVAPHGFSRIQPGPAAARNFFRRRLRHHARPRPCRDRYLSLGLRQGYLLATAAGAWAAGLGKKSYHQPPYLGDTTC